MKNLFGLCIGIAVVAIVLPIAFLVVGRTGFSGLNLSDC